jgi:hypothetical protein
MSTHENALDGPAILAEPDRPGSWLWCDNAGWMEVTVGLISGGGLLHCWENQMADVDGRPWAGKWKLLKQSGPPYGRAARLYKPNARITDDRQ